MQLNIALYSDFFNKLLLEDIGTCGDITTVALANEDMLIDFKVIAKENLRLCGLEIAKWYFTTNNVNITNSKLRDGDHLNAGEIILQGRGKAHKILILERTVLNIMQHLSGVATTTSLYVDQVKHTKAKITDTRKTLPGLRFLQKYAVRIGGGHNHRTTLDSAILIKDNHIAAVGGVSEALRLAKIASPHFSRIILECDTIDQFKEAIFYGVDNVILDNMDIDQLRECVTLNKNNIILEASGGVNLQTVKSIAETGVDYISVGAITHSVKSVDISLDV